MHQAIQNHGAKSRRGELPSPYSAESSSVTKNRNHWFPGQLPPELHVDPIAKLCSAVELETIGAASTLSFGVCRKEDMMTEIKRLKCIEVLGKRKSLLLCMLNASRIFGLAFRVAVQQDVAK